MLRPSRPRQVRLVKELLPGQPVGYVVMNETAAARAAGMHRLLRMPEAEVVALHFAMASQEVTAVSCLPLPPPLLLLLLLPVTGSILGCILPVQHGARQRPPVGLGAVLTCSR